VHFNQPLIGRRRSVGQLTLILYQSSVHQFEYILSWWPTDRLIGQPARDPICKTPISRTYHMTVSVTCTNIGNWLPTRVACLGDGNIKDVENTMAAVLLLFCFFFTTIYAWIATEYWQLSVETASSFYGGTYTSGCRNSWRNTGFQYTMARGTFRA